MEIVRMYRVEKFTPLACPRCSRAFQHQNEDWVRLLGRIVDGVKVPIQHTGRGVVVLCRGCEAEVEMIPLEGYQLGSRDEAERLCREEGFVNLVEVEAAGTMARDHHFVYPASGGVEVFGLEPG